MPEIDEVVLRDYVATANNPEYNGDWSLINSKFPEFKDIDDQLLKDYVATANNPDYNGDFEVINSKFPEFSEIEDVVDTEKSVEPSVDFESELNRNYDQLKEVDELLKQKDLPEGIKNVLLQEQKLLKQEEFVLVGEQQEALKYIEEQEEEEVVGQSIEDNEKVVDIYQTPILQQQSLKADEKAGKEREEAKISYDLEKQKQKEALEAEVKNNPMWKVNGFESPTEYYDYMHNAVDEDDVEYLKYLKPHFWAADKVGGLAQTVVDIAKGGKNFFDATFQTGEDVRKYLTGSSKEEREAYMNVMRDVAADMDKPFEDAIDFTKDFQYESEYETIVDAIQAGDLSETVDMTIKGVVSSLPYLALSALGPGGIFAIGATTAGGKYDELIESDPDEAMSTILLNSGATGLQEAVLEIATYGIISRARGLVGQGKKKAADALINSYSKQMIKTLAIDTGIEGSTEFIQEFANDLIDYTTLSKSEERQISFTDMVDKNIKNWASAGIVGGTTGNLVSSVGALKSDRISVRNAAETALTPESDLKQMNNAGIEINNLTEELNKTTDKDQKAIIQQEIFNKEIEIIGVKQKVTQELNSMTKEELTAYAKNKSLLNQKRKWIKSAPAAFVRESSAQEIENLERENEALIRESVNRRIDENAKKGEKTASQVGNNLSTLNNADSYQKAFNNTEEGRKQSINVRSSDGFIDPSTGDIFINKEAAERVRNVNTAGHEILHAILNNSFREPGQLNNVVKEFKSVLPKEISNKIQQRIDANYRFENFKSEKEAKEKYDATEIKNTVQNDDGTVTIELVEDVYNEEYLTAFADIIQNDKVVYKQNKNVFTQLGEFLKPIFRKKGYGTIKFNTGQDVYDFIESYQKQITEGELQQDILDVAEKGVTGKLITDTKTDTKPTEKVAFSKSVDPKQVQTMIDKVANRAWSKFGKPIPANIKQNAGVTRQSYIESAKTELAGIANEFDSKRTDKDGNPISFDRFMANRGMQRMNSLASRLGVESADKPASKRLGQSVAEGEKEFDIQSKDATPEEALISKEIGDDTRKGIKLAERLGDDAKKISEKVKQMKPVLEGKTYKTLKDLAPDDTQRMFGIKPKPGNLTKDDVRNAQAFIRKNADILLAMLPEGTTISGKATGLQKVLLDPFYTKGRRVKAAKTGSTQGLATQNKKPNIKASEFLEVFGITPAGQPNVADRNTSARIKALVDQTGKLLTNQAVRESMPDAPVEITEGKSRVMFAKSVKESKEPGIKEGIDQLVRKENIEPITMGKYSVDRLKNMFLEDALDTFGNFLWQDVTKTGKFQFALSTVLSNAGNTLARAQKAGFPFIGSYAAGLKAAKQNLIKEAKLKNKELSEVQAEKEALAIMKPTRDALDAGELFETSVLQTQLKDIIKKREKKFTSRQLRLLNSAVDGQKANKLEKNLENIKDINEGKDLLLDLMREQYQKDPKSLDFLSFIAYHHKSNSNPYRNFATVIGRETDLKIPYEEHTLPFGEFATMMLQAITKPAKVFKGFKTWIKDNYFQEVIDKSPGGTVDILDQPQRSLAKDGKTQLPLWRSANKLHPLLKQQVKEALGGKRSWDDVVSADIRKYNEYTSTKGYVNPNKVGRFGKTDAQRYNVEVPNNLSNNPDIIELQNDLIYRQLIGKIDAKTAKAELDISLPVEVSKNKTNQKVNVPSVDSARVMDTKDSENMTSEDVLNKAASLDEALRNARNPNAQVKKIRVFDFDDTLARTKSNVLYTMPDGTTGKLTAEEFAQRGDEMLQDGAVYDFSEFNKVMDGKKGPLFEAAKRIQEARGADDIFVLTARAQEASPAIKEFLDSIGLNIPLNNISGLGDSSPFAKSNWIVDKAAEGYNDFYFADDQVSNVKAVRDALEVLDVKSKTQQAKIKFSESMNEQFNIIIEKSKGIDRFKIYSDVKAQLAGARKGRFKFFIPPSAEDFQGLLYATLGKGKQGEAHMRFYDQALLKPYAQAMENLSADRVALMNDFKALKKELDVPKDLRKKTKSGFTNEQAVRVYLWAKTGQDIPGLSKKDFKELNDIIENDPKLKVFADQMLSITKGDGYSNPGEAWQAGTITTDLIELLNTTKRSKYLETWNENIDTIFSKENMNKLEAALGSNYVEALKNSISRMKAGRNRINGGNRLSDRVLNYINQSTGAIMFFNMRSALLQTISAANFVNWSFNNPLKAGKAFANQPQYWKDFTKLMNSEYLLDRRNGLKLNISESEIADAAKTSKNKAKAALNYIIEKGYIPTKFADSFAIASGGATFYRNKINDLMKNEGKTLAEAEEIAMKEFRRISEISQQSSDPSMISQQQSTDLGRVVLQFVNTPMQYARIQKKAAQDIINGRGDNKTNVSKIIYYAFLQNLIFNALQSGLFAMGFGDDDDELSEGEEKKIFRAANGMMDSWLRGLGFAGVTVQVLKNLGIDIYDRSQKDRPEYSDAWQTLLQFSPAIKSKLSKLKGAGYPFDSKTRRQEIFDKGFSLDNPAYESLAKVITATTNVPLDRLFTKVNNIKGALEEDQETWKSVAMLLGWPEWQLEDKKDSKPKTPEEKAVSKEEKKKARYKAAIGSTDYDTIKDLTAPQQIKLMKSLGIDNTTIKKAKSEDAKIKIIIKKNSGEEPTEEEKKEVAKQVKFDEYKSLTKKDQVEKLLELGLTKAEIRALKYEEDRVKKLLELEE